MGHENSININHININHIKLAEAKSNRGLSVYQRSGACVKVEAAVLGSPSSASLVASVDVKQHGTFAYQPIALPLG